MCVPQIKMNERVCVCVRCAAASSLTIISKHTYIFYGAHACISQFTLLKSSARGNYTLLLLLMVRRLYVVPRQCAAMAHENVASSSLLASLRFHRSTGIRVFCSLRLLVFLFEFYFEHFVHTNTHTRAQLCLLLMCLYMFSNIRIFSQIQTRINHIYILTGQVIN